MAEDKLHSFLSYLLEKGAIDEKACGAINEARQLAPAPWAEIILKKEFLGGAELYKHLSDYYAIPYEKTLHFADKKELLKTIPAAYIRKHLIVPFHVKGGTVTVAIADPSRARELDALAILLPGYRIEAVLSTEDECYRIIHENFDEMQQKGAHEELDGLKDADLDMLGASSLYETEDILDMANEAPIIRFVNRIITEAVQDRASDIHIEPFEKDLLVRYRIDGILYKMHTPPKNLQPAIISRIKIMSNLNIAENRLPQDGRIQLKIGKKDIDIRVSIFPTHYGERVVLRLLNKSDMSFELANIGFAEAMLSQFTRIIEKPHGILLVTGPTGSGKSTTLYSALSKLNTADVNILTVEDPIEYQLFGIGQMQVQAKIGLTFASGLRSILRQDPDIIMVGEIRDLETAEIAVQSALTGHKVFSTIHTNDAASAVTRLVDMGIEPFLISSSVNGFLAQRLVRTICPECRESYKPDAKQLQELSIKPSQLQGGKLYRGRGCEKCLNTGYSGRTGIYELLEMTNAIRRLVLSNADSVSIKDEAVEQGMVTLLQDGIAKAIEGITTIEEVMRVSGL